ARRDLWFAARRDGLVDAIARRDVCKSGAPCRPPSRAYDVPAHARALPALPSRAQDRRPYARARTRTKWHRGTGPSHHPPDAADFRRAVARIWRALVRFRLALRRS